MEETRIAKAASIAAYDLQRCLTEKGILSGTRRVYWSWDSFFASFGALVIGEHKVVRENLRMYLDLQRSDGLIPKRLAHPLYWMRFIGIRFENQREKHRETFANSYFTDVCITPSATITLAFFQYVKKSGDISFAAQYFDHLEKSFEFLEKRRGKEGLLKEGLGGGWAESVLKRDAIAFTNMCYCESLRRMSMLAELLGRDPLAKQYYAKYQQQVAACNTYLWSEQGGGFYSDWLGKTRHHHFATDGNLLAIWWGIADETQAQMIQRKINELQLEDQVPIRLAYDPYSFWRVYIFNRLGGIANYHVGYSWTWLGCIDVLAKLRLGQREQALIILDRIAEVIVRDGTVHEIYDGTHQVRTFWYKSEYPWAWGAGLFLYAASQAGITITLPNHKPANLLS